MTEIYSSTLKVEIPLIHKSQSLPIYPRKTPQYPNLNNLDKDEHYHKKNHHKQTSQP
jgi:hypothetical protein